MLQLTQSSLFSINWLKFTMSNNASHFPKGTYYVFLPSSATGKCQFILKKWTRKISYANLFPSPHSLKWWTHLNLNCVLGAFLIFRRFLGRKRMNTHQPSVPRVTVCELHPVMSKGDAEGTEFLFGEKRARNIKGWVKKLWFSEFTHHTQFIASPTAWEFKLCK